MIVLAGPVQGHPQAIWALRAGGTAHRDEIGAGLHVLFDQKVAIFAAVVVAGTAEVAVAIGAGQLAVCVRRASGLYPQRASARHVDAEVVHVLWFQQSPRDGADQHRSGLAWRISVVRGTATVSQAAAKVGDHMAHLVEAGHRVGGAARIRERTALVYAQRVAARPGVAHGRIGEIRDAYAKTMPTPSTLIEVRHDGHPARVVGCPRIERTLVDVAVTVGIDGPFRIHKAVVMQAHVVANLVRERVVGDAIHMDEVVGQALEVRRQFMHQVPKAAKSHFHDNADDVCANAVANGDNLVPSLPKLFLPRSPPRGGEPARQLQATVPEIEVRYVGLLRASQAETKVYAATGVGIVGGSYPQVDQRSDIGDAAGLLDRALRPKNKDLHDGAVIQAVIRLSLDVGTTAASRIVTHHRHRQRRQRCNVHFPQHLPAVCRADVVQPGGRPHRAHHDIAVDHQRGRAVRHTRESTGQRIPCRGPRRPIHQRIELRVVPQIQRHPGGEALPHTPMDLAKLLEVHADDTLPNDMVRFRQRTGRQRLMEDRRGASTDRQQR